MTNTKRAAWQTEEHDSTWDRVKAAFRNDWEQTKNDFGVDGNRDLDQDIDDTVEQMLGKESTVRYGEMDFDDIEDPFRYGAAGQSHYGLKHKCWDDEVSKELQKDYSGDWKRDEPLIRYSYNRSSKYN